MESSFGARLRQHRERQRIDLATVAGATKIKASLLEELERGDLSHWPGGLFRRAYLRSYAQAVSLDADAIVREIAELFPEPVEHIESPAPRRGLRGFVGAAVETLSGRLRGEEPPPLRPSRSAERPVVTLENPRQPVVPDDSRDSPREGIGSAPVLAPVAAHAALANVPAETPAPEIKAPQVDLVAAARLCTDLGRATTSSQVEELLREVASVLDARGIVVWLWDPLSSQLHPALSYGYSARVLAQLRALAPDADNVTAAAFRSAQTSTLDGCGESSAALAVPLLTSAGCAGVLAIELPPGRAGAESVRATATFFAAILAQLFGAAAPQADSSDEGA